MQKLYDLIITSDWLFVGAVLGGATLRLMLSEGVSPYQAVVAFSCAIFCAVFFTGPILSYLELTGNSYEYGLAAILALSGETFVRRILASAQTGKISDIKKGMK